MKFLNYARYYRSEEVKAPMSNVYISLQSSSTFKKNNGLFVKKQLVFTNYSYMYLRIIKMKNSHYYHWINAMNVYISLSLLYSAKLVYI